MSTASEHAHKPFWRIKPLRDMSDTEWESLCSRCGICCLNRFRDGKTGKVHFTRIACRFLDTEACVCTVYERPFYTAPECEKMTPEKIPRLLWLPKTCGYRCVVEGRDLEWWHPLKSGDPDSVHAAGVSVRNRVVSEIGVSPAELEKYILPADRMP